MRWKMAFLVSCLSFGLGGNAFAQQDSGINGISTFEVQEESAGTLIRINGNATPTFSVFKLNEPLRLFIDVSNSELSGEPSTRRVGNGVVSQVALLEFKDNVQSVTRVIIGFDQAAHYDVRTEGNDVVVFVDGAKRSNGSNALAKTKDLEKREAQIRTRESNYQSELAQREAQMEKSRSALSKREKELARLEKQLQNTSGANRSKVTKEIAAKNSEINALEGDVKASRSALKTLQGQVATLERERSALAKQASTSMAQRDQALALAESKEREGAAARKRAEKLKKNLAKTEVSLAKADKQAKGLQNDLASANDRAAEKQAQVSAARKELDAAKSREAKLRQEIASLSQSASRGDSDATNALRRAQQEQTRVRSELAAREAEMEKAKVASSRAKRALNAAQDKLAKRDVEIQTLQQQLNSVRAQQSRETKRANEANDERVAALEKALSTERARVAALEAKQSQVATNSKIQKVESKLGEARLAQNSRGQLGRAIPVQPTANKLRGVRLEKVGDRSRIIVELDRPGSFETLPWKDSRAVMILNGVELPEALAKTLADSGQAGAVRFVSTYRDNHGRVHLEAELSEGVTEVVRQDGNKLIWEFAPAAPNEFAGNNPVQTRPAADSFTAAPPRYPVVVTDPTRVSRVPGMSRTKITIDLREADVQNVLRLLAKQGGVNIVAGSEVSGRVTMRLRSVPLDEVFLTVLQATQLGFEKRGNVIRVAPQTTLVKEQQLRSEIRAASAASKPLEVFLMPVNYASAADLQEQITSLVSPRGTVSVDSRTNTLVIKDIAENVTSIRALVESLDSQVPQVLIEARIVETNDTFTQSIGIQWGGDANWSQVNGNPTGLAFPSVLGLTGGATDSQAPVTGVSSNPNYAVNLPAPAGTGAGGAIGLTMGSVGGAFNLNLRLSALEAAGHVKIVSAPKILTLDNQTATISQGTSIPISVVSAAGVQTVFVDATLELTVTPHVTPDGNIQLTVSASKNEPDFQNRGARGDPTIIRKQAETELLIKDGDTTVIGGIYTRNAGTSISAVPFLHRIPILGFFFRSESEREQRTELLIFITPRIVNRAESIGGGQ